jgi:hypothetical protein
MSAEAEYLPDRAVLNWAIGCVIATTKMRCIEMFTLRRDVSRPIITLEILVCFGSLVFAGVQFAWISFQAPSLISHVKPGASIVTGVLLGVAGVLGIAQGLRQVLKNRHIPISSAFSIATAAGAFAAATWAADSSTWLSRDLILLCVLPAVGAWHLRYLSHPSCAT